MNDQIIGFLTTSGGLAIGWTLNELSGWFKSGRDRRQVLNRILFHQLSIRDAILKTNIQSMEKAIENILSSELDAKQRDLHELASKVFNKFIQDELNRRFSNDIKRLTEEYKKTLLELSKIDPYVTYQISDKEVVLDYLAYLDDYFHTVKTQVKNDQTSAQQVIDLDGPVAEIRKHLTPIIWETARETIESDILLIAKAQGFWFTRKTKQFLERTKELQLDQSAVAKLQKYMKSFYPEK